MATLLKLLQRKHLEPDYIVTEKDRKSIRQQLCSKGFFQRCFPYPPNHVYGFSRTKLFRAVIDETLFWMTSEFKEERRDAFRWLKFAKEDFALVCQLAVLKDRETTLKYIETIVKNIFPEVYEEYILFKELKPPLPLSL